MKSLGKATLMAAAILATATFAFAQSYTLVPDKVPPGAYVNGSDGDQQYIQRLRYTVGANWTGPTPGIDITIALPDSMTIADTDGDNATNLLDEVSSWESGVATAMTVAATATQITIDVTAGQPAATNWIEVVFPIETASGASGSQNYTVTFANDAAGETNGTVSVTFSATPLNADWTSYYEGDDDQSSTLGDVYPAAVQDFFDAGIDFVYDVAHDAGADGNGFFGTVNAANDDGEVTTVIWASQDPNLTRINNQNAHRPFDIALVQPSGNDGVNTVGIPTSYQLDGTLLAEDYWFLYLTSSATGDWVVARSDSVNIRHWPTFTGAADEDDAGGMDVDEIGGYTPGGGADDALTLYLESGGTIGKDGAFVAANNMSTVDIYWSFQDVDDNALLDIFLSTVTDLTVDSLVITGSDGSEVVTGVSSTNSIKVTPSSILEESSTEKFTYDIYTDKNTYETAGTYYVYLVANDSTNQAVYQMDQEGAGDADKQLIIQHYPYFKYDDIYPLPALGDYPFLTATNDYYVISWAQTPASGLGDGDIDADDNATITFYWTDSDLDAILIAAAGPTVIDAALLANAAWTSAVTLIDSTTEDPDGVADNRYMWNVGAVSPALTDGNDYNVIAHIRGGSDHLFVQYGSALGPEAVPVDDRDFIPTHGEYFRMVTPLEGETVTLEGGDEFIFEWSGFDRDAAGAGLVQVFAAPAGTDVPTVLGGIGTTNNDWTNLEGQSDDVDNAALDGWYWLFPITGGGEGSAGATSGPTITSGTITLDVSDITDDMDSDGTDELPSGFYDIWYFTTYTGTFGADAPAQADGVFRFTGSAEGSYSFRLSPNAANLGKGDTVTVSVMVESPSALGVRLLSFSIDVPSTYYTVIDQGTNTPFIGESVNFAGSSILQNEMTSNDYYQLDYVEVDDTPTTPLNTAGGLAVASFQVTVSSAASGTELISDPIEFINTATRTTGIVDQNGNDEAVTMASPAADFLIAPPGSIAGQVALEILADNGQSVDIHVLPLGSFTPISDADFLSANGGANSDGSISVTLGTDGAYTVSSIPTGDYDILAHKDYHLDQLSQNVAVRPAYTTTVNFLGADMLLTGDIAGRDSDTDPTTASVPDNQVNTDDIAAVSDAFGTSSGDDDWNAAADFDGDDYVYIADYNVVVTNSGTNGEGLIFKGIPGDANENVVARLLALSEMGDEVTFAIALENLSSLHAYAVEMDYNPEHWELLSFNDGLAEYNRAVELHKAQAYGSTFASAIIGRDVIRIREMALMTMTLKSKVNDPEEISISSVSLIDGNRGLSEAILGSSEAVPTAFSLSQNFPNPFNPTTTISFSLPDMGQVKLAVYNLLGQEVRSLMAGDLEAGTYKAIWNSRDDLGRKVSSGLYFYRLVVDNQVIATKKMVLLK